MSNTSEDFEIKYKYFKLFWYFVYKIPLKICILYLNFEYFVNMYLVINYLVLTCILPSTDIMITFTVKSSHFGYT
jgi:hypothetical protein